MPVAVRAFARVLMRGLIGRGSGSNAIIRAVQGQGWGYRRTTMLADINLFAGQDKNSYWVKQINVNEVIPTGLMTPVEMGMPYNYRVYCNTNYYDPDTDTYVTEHESFYTNDYANVGEWQKENELRTLPDSPAAEYEFVNTRIVNVDIDANYLSSLTS